MDSGYIYRQNRCLGSFNVYKYGLCIEIFSSVTIRFEDVKHFEHKKHKYSISDIPSDDPLRPQSTFIPRIPQCLSPRLNWDPPTPLPQANVLPPGTKGGRVHTRLRVRGWGSPNSDDWRESLVLCLLCAWVSPLRFLPTILPPIQYT